MTVPRLAAVAVGMSLAAPLYAQELSFRLGGLRAQYADTIDGNAALVGARLAWSTRRFRGVLDGSWARYGTGDGVAQAWASGDVIAWSSRRVALGVHADGVVNAVYRGPSTLTGTGELFGAAAVGPVILALGLDGGGVRTLSGARRPVGAAVLRARWFRGRWNVGLGLSATASDTIRYRDATLSAEWRGRRLTAGALVGGRGGDLARGPWTQAWTTVNLTRAVSLEVGAGSYPKELSGFDRGRYALAGLRVRFGRRDLGAAGLDFAALRSAGTAGTQVVRLDSGRVEVRFRLGADDSGAVAIAGDWNEWVPTPLTSDGPGRWRAVVAVTPGPHRFALVTAGGRWVVPAGVTRLPDDFGGEVGLLVVP